MAGVGPEDPTLASFAPEPNLIEGRAVAFTECLHFADS